jgi:hypothetical protein
MRVPGMQGFLKEKGASILQVGATPSELIEKLQRFHDDLNGVDKDT